MEMKKRKEKKKRQGGMTRTRLGGKPKLVLGFLGQEGALMRYPSGEE